MEPIDATLTEAHSAYRSSDFHRALQLCQNVRVGLNLLCPKCAAKQSRGALHPAEPIDASLTEAHSAHRSSDFHRALQLCQNVHVGFD